MVVEGADKTSFELDSTRKQMTDMSDRIKVLENKLLAAEHTQGMLRSQMDTIVPFFEFRVDQIYSRIIELFGEGKFEKIAVNVSKSEEHDKGFLPLAADRLSKPIDVDTIVFERPLTARGFRIRDSHARENDEGVLVEAGNRELALFGPYYQIAPGSYSVTVEISIVDDPKGRGTIQGDVYLPNHGISVTSLSLYAEVDGVHRIVSSFEVPDGSLTPIEFRFWRHPGFGYVISGIKVSKESASADVVAD